jgi:hypothetical protein
VVWARLGRVGDVYRPFENARYSASEGRHINVAYAGLWVYEACIPFAMVGGLFLWRRNHDAVRVLLAPFLVVIATAIYAFGAVRFRAIAEPSLIVMASVGVVTCWQRVQAHGSAIATNEANWPRASAAGTTAATASSPRRKPVSRLLVVATFAGCAHLALVAPATSRVGRDRSRASAGCRCRKLVRVVQECSSRRRLRV